MKFAVLVKPVVDLQGLQIDPERKAVVRGSARLFANPFDQRALLVGLRLRRAGEPLVALSMGPAPAAPLLEETLALGADRAILICDEALRGSDTLITARVLARALRRVGAELVLAGKWTTDSETGQVGGEVASLLGVPLVSGAERIERDAVSDRLHVVAETDDGRRECRVDAPVVISVGEKILKPRKPTSEESAHIPPRRLERWSIADLGLEPAAVGFAGSPTAVTALTDAAPTRSAVILAEGTVADRVERAVALLRSRGLEAPATPFALPPPSGDRSPRGEVLVLVTGPEATVNDAALAIVSELRRTGGSCWPSAGWIGPPPPPAELGRLRRSGAFAVYRVAAPPGPIDSGPAAVALAALMRHRPELAGVVVVSDRFGREVASQTAARLGLGLVGDAVGFSTDTGGGILWAKPAFGSSVIAGVVCRTRPSMATVRPGVFAEGVDDAGPELPVEPVEAELPASRLERVASERRDDPAWGDPARARWVVSVGMGLGSPQAIRDVEATIARWGAALVGSRRVVDAGWLPVQRQAGLTGRSLAPELAVLIGTSGAPNHLIGFRRAGTLLGVNPDPAAPLWRSVDIGIVGAWREVLPLLTEALAPFSPARSPPRR